MVGRRRVGTVKGSWEKHHQGERRTKGKWRGVPPINRIKLRFREKAAEELGKKGANTEPRL